MNVGPSYPRLVIVLGIPLALCPPSLHIVQPPTAASRAGELHGRIVLGNSSAKPARVCMTDLEERVLGISAESRPWASTASARTRPGTPTQAICSQSGIEGKYFRNSCSGLEGACVLYARDVISSRRTRKTEALVGKSSTSEGKTR